MYTITASAAENGTLSYTGEIETVEGSSFLFRMIPEEDYEVDKVFVDGIDMGSVPAYNFEGIEQNSEIKVTFKAKERNSLIQQGIGIIYQTMIEDRLEIREAENCDLCIMDISGKLILSKRRISSYEVIEMSDYPQGIYLVNLSNNQRNKTHKIIKK